MKRKTNKAVSIRKALKNVLEYLLPDERADYREHPDPNHIYRSLLVIKEWLKETKEAA